MFIFVNFLGFLKENEIYRMNQNTQTMGETESMHHTVREIIIINVLLCLLQL